MKRILAMVMFCLLLAGCGAPEVPESTVPPTQTTPPTAAPTEPVEDDAFYFRNGLEFDRLYSQTPDGDTLRLVLDEHCTDVNRWENTLFFLQGRNLCSWDVTAGQKRCVAENVSSYTIGGDCLLYAQFEANYDETLYWQNLRTGDGGKLCTENFVRFAARDGRGYYYRYGEYTDRTSIYCLDSATGETRMIWEGDVYAYGILPLADGIAYSYREEDVTVWEYVSADGEKTGQLEGIGENEPFYADENQVLYVAHFYGTPMYSQIWRQTWDGEATLLAQTDPDAEYAVHPLGDGEFLLEHYAYEEWGPVNEYGYRENYALPTRYSLLHSDGTMIEIDATGEAGSLFAGGDFPVIDSSTARKPVTAELYTLFVKNYGYEGQEPLCSTTHGAWLNIADGVADLALLAAPTPEEQAYLQEKGVEVEMKLYGGDGLVFIGNPENPVRDLTHDQLLDIYRGNITNWEEVGGPDAPITVFYRDDQSGSQRLFEKLVWKDAEIPDFGALGFSIEEAMSSIVDMVQNDPYAIGYTIMTYLGDVYGEDSLRVFSINGVLPSPETVADGTYAYHTQGYLVIRADEPEGSPARRLFDWFGCPISADLLDCCGVTPLQG